MNFCKTAALRVLLSCYVLAMLSSFLPHVEYLFNKSYIVQQLCENRENPALMCEGICYVKKRIVKAETAPAKEHNPAPRNNGYEQYAAHLLQFKESGISPQTSSPLLCLATVSEPSSQFVADIFHPPRAQSFFL